MYLSDLAFKLFNHILFILYAMGFKILIFITLLSLTSCNIGVFMSGNVPSLSLMQCIYRNGYRFATWGQDSTSNGTDPTVLAALTNMKNAGFTVDVAFVPCFATSPAKQIADFVSKIPRNVTDRVWLVADDDSPEAICRWKLNNQKQNCDLMSLFANELRKNKLNVGIMTHQQEWKTFLGNCQSLRAQSLFWDPVKPNGDPSFADFKPFGDWNRPMRKIYNLVVSECGAIVSTAYQP